MFPGRSVGRFLSTPSARRATLRRTRSCTLPKNFYPRPPRGGRHDGLSRAVMFQLISIHALREEGDGLSCLFQQGEFISIHALREEGDPRPSLSSPLSTYFYPRPPRGGRLKATVNAVFNRVFLSTPSARRATIYVSDIPAGPADFYPRPPRGGRRDAQGAVDLDAVFLSTPSARRATVHTQQPLWEREISIHALREEGDFVVYC